MKVSINYYTDRPPDVIRAEEIIISTYTTAALVQIGKTRYVLNGGKNGTASIEITNDDGRASPQNIVK